jgi:hypothetical protein
VRASRSVRAERARTSLHPWRGLKITSSERARIERKSAGRRPRSIDQRAGVGSRRNGGHNGFALAEARAAPGRDPRRAVVAVSVVRRERQRRWTLVALAAAAVVVWRVLGGVWPTRTGMVDPERLRALIMRSEDQPYQGYAESRGTLRLPDLPKLSDVTSLLNGTTRMRSWYGSASRWRFDVVSTAGERDVRRTPDGEFVWDYGADLFTELVGEPALRLPRGGDLLPPDLARRVLRAAPNDPLTDLPSRRIAGITAAGVRLHPTDPDTALGWVDIWADPATGLPVEVDVTARGAAGPVLGSRFLDLSLIPPTLDVLMPIRPRSGGYAVVEAPDIADALGPLGRVALPASLAGRALRSAALGGVRAVGTYGTGLSAFVALPVPRDVGESAADTASTGGATSSALPGGSAVVLQISPLSVLIAHSTVAQRWYLLAGLVVPSLLERAAAELSTVPRSDR